MSFNPIDSPIDYVVLAGQRSPGLADLTGWAKTLNFDERRGGFSSGASLRYRGVGLASGKLTLRLTSAEHWTEWESFRPLVQSVPLDVRSSALDISHPILEDLGVRAVVVTSVKQPTQTADGEWSIEIDLKEYRPPQPARAAVEGSQDRPPEPADEVERAFQTLTGVMNRVAAGGELPVGEISDALGRL